MRQFKCAVFDVDGTLLDTSEGLISSVRYTIARHGARPLGDETIRSFIGPPIQDSFRRIYGYPEDVIREMAATFREHYKGEDLLKARPYEGIYEALAKLKEAGVTVAIATYKRQDYATRILEHFHFDRYTQHMFGSDFDGKLRKEDIIRLSLRAAGIEDNADAAMIGDSENDALGAERVGAAFLGVTYGFGFGSGAEIARYRPVGVANTPEEIAKIILGGRT